MRGGGSQPGQCYPVGGGTVAFVLSQAISYESRIQFYHQPIPMHLGDNGRRGNGDAELVSPHQAHLRQIHPRDPDRIDEEMVRWW